MEESTDNVDNVEQGIDVIGKGYFQPTQLRLPANMSFSEWMALGTTLKAMEKGVNWWIGDWLNGGERMYGEMYSQALDAKEYQTLANIKYVAGVFPPHKRRANLSFSIHAEIAPLMALDPDMANEILDNAEKLRMTVRDVRYDVKLARTDMERAAGGLLAAIDEESGEADASHKEGENGFAPDVSWLDDLLHIAIDIGSATDDKHLHDIQSRVIRWMVDRNVPFRVTKYKPKEQDNGDI